MTLTPKTTVDIHAARNLALNRQFPYLEGEGKRRTQSLIEHLGYVQIDTISVIERAHHHTMWARDNRYLHGDLDELQKTDRAVFEYWGHAASILPMRDYRFYIPLMKRKFRKSAREWLGLDTHDKIMDEVRTRIRSEGALASRDFEDERNTREGGWGDWKPAKRALELLFWGGELMISSREGFQRVYDLTERVLPSSVDTTVPSDNELGIFLVRTALRAHGICTEKDVFDHLPITSKSIIRKAIKLMLEDGEIIPVSVESLEKPLWFLRKTDLENESLINEPPSACKILSPFDNSIILRDRILQLFGFDYKLECYVPAAKRIYGYFTTPILWNGVFTGRMDSKAERREKTLIVRNVHHEDPASIDDRYIEELVAAMKDFARFNQCNHIIIEKCEPKKVHSILKRLLKT